MIGMIVALIIGFIIGIAVGLYMGYWRGAKDEAAARMNLHLVTHSH